jgi:hypothetical protein
MCASRDAWLGDMNIDFAPRFDENIGVLDPALNLIPFAGHRVHYAFVKRRGPECYCRGYPTDNQHCDK